MDKRSCHLRIEFKIEIAHGWISIVLPQYEAGRFPLFQSGRPFPDEAARINRPGVGSAEIDAVLIGSGATSTSN
jgi:hypothetical protein